MVLWEITLATAYFLGLKRTYRLALRLQRRVIGPNHPRLREFVYRRTKAAFTLALNMHKEIQRRDLSVGRNIGSRILRMLDRMRPQANIRGSPPDKSGGQSAGPVEGKSEKGDSIKRASNETDTKPVKAAGKNEAPKPPVTAYVSGQFGFPIKNQVNYKSSRLTPKPSMQVLPVAALGLWWQPVRRNMESMLVRDGPLSHSKLPLFGRLPSTHFMPTSAFGVSRGVLREDIAVWMQR